MKYSLIAKAYLEDQDKKYPGIKRCAIFEKGFIHYTGIIKRPTRCFRLKEERVHE